MAEAVPAAAIAAAAVALDRGELVCIPTETTYGLAARIDRPAALAALVTLKGRDPSAPFGLIAGDAQAARTLAASWPAVTDELATEHWPGPLTLVVPARPGLPAELIGPGGGVGVRVSSHPWALALARAAGVPLTATSANPSGAPPALEVAQARAYFGDRVAIYLDAGPSRDTAASTVAAIGADGSITVLRPGPVRVSTSP
ncbi:MAG TPA: L-threonylcarbamoyladenylate synthase [Kofleriaceae bacterium]|nr:L-threonylcarbamoyladenylate synthase [Kofleriaceae bacterium]